MAINQKQKKWIGMTVIFFVVFLVMGILASSGSLDRFQLQLSSLLYQTRQTSAPIVIVGVDQQTVNEMGQTASWTRDNYAQAIKNISKYNPAVIGLDYTFNSKGTIIPVNKLNELISDQESSSDISGKLKTLIGSDLNQYDQALSDEIKNNQKVVTLYPPQSSFSRNELGNTNFVATEPFAPFAPNEKNRIGLFNMLTEEDGSLRKYVPLMHGQKDYPSFGLAIVAKYLGANEIKVDKISAESLSLELGENKLNIPLSGYQFLINFGSKTIYALQNGQNLQDNNFKYIHFVDAYNGDFSKIDPQDIQGKIVLIGPYLQTGDNYKVPIDGDYQMWGVMIHGQAIQTILDQAWLRDMSFGEVMVVTALLILLALGLIFGVRIVWALVGMAVLEIIYCVVVGPWAFRNGLILNLIYPPVAIVMTAIVAYAYRYLTEFRQKTVVADALGKYVSKNVAEQVLEDGKEVVRSGEKCQITVIFTDIKSFTSISEKLTPQSLVALLNDYFEVMSGIITRNGGSVDKFEGDAIMALFGAPGVLSDHAAKACAAALEMRAALPLLMEKWKSSGTLPGGESYPEVDFRVGISTGEAVVGNIGSAEHLSYTAIGDIVNLGSRLESANKKYQTHVMISEPTFEAVSELFECRYIDKIRVKGKETGVMVYELICKHGELSAEQAELIPLYNQGITLYYQRKFIEALRLFEEQILVRWPKDNLAQIYAARCEVLKRFPPSVDWDFIYTMDSK